MIDYKEIAASVKEYLESHRDEMILFLKELVTMETPSNEISTQHKILDFLKMKFETMGFWAFHVPGQNTGGYLYARPSNRDKSLPLQLLIGHCDTVWPTGTIKQMPLAYKDGKMRGPGIYDMKAGLTQIVFALLAIKAIPLPMKMTPIIFINSDEDMWNASTP